MEEKQEEKDMGETDREVKDMEERHMEERKDTVSKAKEEASKAGTKEAEKVREVCMRSTCGGADKDTTTALETGVGGRSHSHGATAVYARLGV